MVKRSVALFGIVSALIGVAPRASTSSAEDTRPDCDVVIGSASAGTIKPAPRCDFFPASEQLMER